jgi:hypothetical protein
MRLLIFISLFVLVVTGCGRWIVGGNPANTPANNYDIFYRSVKENYAFFAEKGVNWDSLDRHYRPLVTDSLGNDSLYSILSAMLFALRDGHVNLYVNNDRSRNADWYLDFPANFNEGVLRRQYLGKNYQASGPLANTWLDSVGYVYYGSFSSPIAKGNLDYVLNRFAHSKGLIIDVRDNGGGSLGNVFKLMERLIPEKTFVGTIDQKTGPEADSFSERDSFFITPLINYNRSTEGLSPRKKKKAEEAERRREEFLENPPPVRKGGWAVADSTGMMLHKPIVVLINRHSYSATNFFAAFMSTLPNVTLIGDRSGGGGGIPVSYELPNGWKIRFSATRTYLPNGQDIENGIEPDIYQATGPAEELQGVDAIIERAKAYILEQANAEKQ